MGAQLEITKSQKIHKEILEVEVNISQKYIDNLLDNITKDLLTKKEIAINILVLLAILIYTGRDFLGSLLEERRTTIVEGVQDAEDRLSESKKRLVEAEKQLNQANIVISAIKTETVVTKKSLLESDAFQAKKDLTIRFDRALASFRSKERQIFIEIKQQIISLLQRTVNRVQETFK